MIDLGPIVADALEYYQPSEKCTNCQKLRSKYDNKNRYLCNDCAAQAKKSIG